MQQTAFLSVSRGSTSTAYLVTNVPQSYCQAIALINATEWKNAMEYEHDKIVEHQVAEEIDRPPD